MQSHVCLLHVPLNKSSVVKPSLKGMHASSLMQLQRYGMCSTSTEEVKKCLWRIPMMDVNSSGAELPAAMNVAPATSSLRLRRCEKGVRDI